MIFNYITNYKPCRYIWYFYGYKSFRENQTNANKKYTFYINLNCKSSYQSHRTLLLIIYHQSQCLKRKRLMKTSVVLKSSPNTRSLSKKTASTFPCQSFSMSRRARANCEPINADTTVKYIEAVTQVVTITLTRSKIVT